jgi:dienelactone hydrolase
MKYLLPALVVLAAAGNAQAKIQNKTIEYSHAGTTLKGYLAYDDSISGKRPGVLVVHEWWGLNDYARSRADQLAKLGYVAFAADMYGEGKTTEHPAEAREMATKVRMNVDDWQKRALAGLEILTGHKMVDPERIAAIGYCFGGATVLQLAYSGADVDAVVSFHGALPSPTAEQEKQIKSKILICHGAADSFITQEQIDALKTALDRGGVDWQMAIYGHAKHSFTNPHADEHNIEGIAYNKHADKRSWQAMQDLFAETFAKR